MFPGSVTVFPFALKFAGWGDPLGALVAPHAARPLRACPEKRGTAPVVLATLQTLGMEIRLLPGLHHHWKMNVLAGVAALAGAGGFPVKRHQVCPGRGDVESE